MKKLKIKRKYIFLGDIDSINIELIIKSFNFLKNKVNYILICNKKDIQEKIKHCDTSNSVINVLNSRIKKNLVNWSKF